MTDRHLIGGMLNFAAEILAARETVRFTMGEGGGAVLREEAIAHLPGIALNLDEAWMRIERLREMGPPDLPEMFDGWIEGKLGNAETRPQLRAERMLRVSIEEASDLVEAGLANAESCFPIRTENPKTGDVGIVEGDVMVRLAIAHLDEFRGLFENWVASAWMPWAAEEAPRRRTIRTYQTLFKLHGMMQSGAGSTAFELVWGIGASHWRRGPTTIDLPLIEVLADIELEGGGDLVIRPRDVRPKLAIDPYIALEVPDAHRAQTQLEAHLTARVADPDLPLSPFDPASHEDILQRAADLLTGTAAFVSRLALDDGAKVQPAGPDLVIYGRWALFARPRSEHVRREDLIEMARKVEACPSDDELPEPLRGFVRHIEEPATADEGEFDDDFFASTPQNAWDAPGAQRPPGAVAAGNPVDARYYFPLPFNKEQAAIIDTLEAQKVAVVQGPPGTGKSHSIANIIAHYMATGRRVLVTARTAEAISVIQEKLPEQLRRLTIAVVHSDREGARQLEEAVSAMADDARAVDQAAIRTEIADTEARIRDVDAAVAALEARLGAVARANLTPIEHDGESLMPMDLAERLAASAGMHGWFVDRPAGPAPDHALVAEIAALRGELGRDIEYLAAVEAGTFALPRPGDLPGAAELLAANRQAASIHARKGAEDFTGAPEMVRDHEDAEANGRALHATLAEIDEWLANREDWERALYVARAGQAIQADAGSASAERPSADAGLDRRLDAAAASLEAYLRDTKGLDPGICDIPGAAGTQFWRAVEDLSRGVQPLGFAAKLFQRTLLAELDAVRVDGKAPASASDWGRVLQTRRWREVEERLCDAFDELGTHPALPPVPPAGERPDPAATHALHIETIAQLREAEERARRAPALAAEARRLFLYGIEIEADLARGDHARLRWALRANLPENAARHPALDALDRAALGDLPVHDLIRSLGAAIDGPPVEPQEIVEAANTLAGELRRLHERSDGIVPLSARLAALSAAGAPAWAAALADSSRLDEDLLPASWHEAWAWGAARAKIEAIHGLEDADALRTARSGLSDERRRLFEALILKRTLYRLARRIKGPVSSALQSFTYAIRRLGKGTGKEAERWRREIRAAALGAASAAPVWIMPEHKVAEQLPKTVGDFELVILDEASQSDVTALGALARGKRLLIVGDDQQVSPTVIGVTTEKISQLRTRFLGELEHRNKVDAESSVFDLAQLMFPAAQLMLREHFRSVAPIIAFSSRFYRGGLVPLRIPRRSERIDPPLVDIYLPDGAREGTRNVNRAEARTIVDEIARIVADPAMAHRSIGVISLIGRHQADTIERMLMEEPEIGLERMQRHRIICGDSSTLQGQERDIVFLSMVSDRRAIRTMADMRTQQRFNVAMSRARDRAYLVRSLALSQMNAADLRHQVIDHFRAPLPEGVALADAGLLDRCQSGFEREVCERLMKAGYRIVPQMRAGAFSIDIVVEGAEDRRLAIELDGDRFHGPDRWHEDMERQAMLERAGWVFWRVFGSQWKADPDLWWDRLVERLASLDIEPIGQAGIDEVFTEHRTIRDEAGMAVIAGDFAEAEEPEAVAATAAAGAASEAPATGPAAETEPDAVIVPLVRRVHAGRAKPDEDRQGLLPLAEAIQADEGDFHLEEAQPEIVETGMTVTLLYLDDDTRRSVRFSADEHRPDHGIVGLDSPLAEVLIGAAVGETVAVDIAGRTRRILVERLLPDMVTAAE